MLRLLGSIVWHLLQQREDGLTSGKAVTITVPTNKRVQLEEISIRRVDGDKVKIKYDMNFCEGGNGYRYSFVPEHEIWVDSNIDTHDVKFIALHEIIERYYMQMGYTYNRAHEIANRVEKKYRMRSKRLAEREEE